MRNFVSSVVLGMEIPILVFPVLTTCIVALGFVFNLTCEVWEWWLAAFLTIGMTWWKNRNLRATVAISIAFLITLAFLWITSNLLTTSGNVDSLSYHQPAIRLLASGWNPVWQNTPEGIYATSGLSPESLHIWHIISMPKGIWYFCAVAYRFTNAHFNLFFPLVPFIAIAVIYSICDAFSRKGVLATIFACGATFCFLNVTYDFLVDFVVNLAAIGLLLTFLKCLSREYRSWPWARLMAFSFWMVVAKQPSLLHCFIFWCVFCTVLIVRKRKDLLAKSVITGVTISLLFCLVNVAPYLTSSINYGSPFYPRYSGNEEKFPTQNITGDFLERNDDAAMMGHIGAYVNAFISPELAKAYYSMKTGKRDFCPVSTTWEQNCAKRSPGSPTDLPFRILFCGSLIALCLCGRRRGIFYAGCIVFGTLALPTEMLGYIRYTPWALSGCAFAPILMLDRVPNGRIRQLIMLACVGLCITTTMAHLALFGALKIDQGYAILASLKDNPPSVLIPASGDSKANTSDAEIFSGNVILLKRAASALGNAMIKAGPDIEASPSQCYFDYSFNVSFDYDICKYSVLRSLVNIPDRKKRLMSYPKFIAQTFFITLPKSIWEVING